MPRANLMSTKKIEGELTLSLTRGEQIGLLSSGWVVLFQRVKIDVLIERFLAFNNFRACQSHETDINMLYPSREICPR